MPLYNVRPHLEYCIQACIPYRNKCKCLHIGHGNVYVNNTMGYTALGTTVKEKDLGVTIRVDANFSEQYYIFKG